MAATTASTSSSTLVVGVLILVAATSSSSPVLVSPPYLFGEEPPSPVVLADSYGYFTETHEVESNGYLLTLFRIRGPRPREDKRDTESKTEFQHSNFVSGRKGAADEPADGVGPPEPFILQHGLATNAAQWVMFGPERSLAYALADKGFDVWLASGRGSKYGKKHKLHRLDSDAFWDFSWHEQGAEDLPAIVDHVLNATGYRQVWYAGHSMGTTMMFVMNALRPDYDAKVRHHFALAPTAYLGRVKNPTVVDFISRLDENERLWASLGLTHFSSEAPLAYSSRGVLCALVKQMCKRTFFYDVFKADATQDFDGQSEIVNAYMPGDFSTKQVIHFGQNALEGESFRWYDLGPAENKLQYNSSEPPVYDMSRVTVPATFIYGENDQLTVPEDVIEFSKRFNSSSPRLHPVPLREFNHADFISARDQKELVHDPILAYVDEIRRAHGFIAQRGASEQKQSTPTPTPVDSMGGKFSKSQHKLGGKMLPFEKKENPLNKLAKDV